MLKVPAHASPPPHTHPDHEQAGMVLSGEYEMDYRRTNADCLNLGMHTFIPPGVEHALHGLDGPAIAIDVFSPPREEYKIENM
ncbi:MAG: hypothetical protein CM1200mP37_4870 [Chloroflexota bacterium]|nr:MAG: hypothetical protein CM1200mP37_4870 [Chloroflexota bacterium]